MKTPNNGLRSLLGFTLIELLVVISIIALLAALIIPIGGRLMQNAAKKRAYTELQQVVTAIESYKSKLGFYPPDNPANYAAGPLYYELAGCRRAGGGFTTLDGVVSISVANLTNYLGATGIMNASSATGSDDETTAATFIRDIKPGQYGERIVAGVERVRVLGTSVPGQLVWPPLPQQLTDISINPFRYNSSNPANNPTSYDLWVDVIVGGKTNRISNWSSKPQVL
jgi:prepilin-type N-terminal cleavage/methylation domain-containing protein